jgi:hypothetical protein
MQQLPQVYVVLDALDECAQCVELAEVLEAIASQQLLKVNLIMRSHGERYIKSSLKGFVDLQNRIDLQSGKVDKDIQQYVRQRPEQMEQRHSPSARDKGGADDRPQGNMCLVTSCCA